MLLHIQYSVFLFIRGICQLVQVLRYILGYMFSTRRCKSDELFLNKQRSINTDVYFGNVCLPFIYFFLLRVLSKSINPSIICKKTMFLFQMYSKLIFMFLVCQQPQRKVGAIPGSAHQYYTQYYTGQKLLSNTNTIQNLNPQSQLGMAQLSLSLFK